MLLALVTLPAHIVGNMQVLLMGLRKLQHYCLRTATDFTDICSICKLVPFRFSGTRKTNKQCLKLCVYWNVLLFWVQFAFNKPEDAFCVFRCEKCDFLINNMFQLQFVATGRSVELSQFNLIVLGSINGVCNTSGCCLCHRNFVWYREKWRDLIWNIVSVCVWETSRLNPLRFTFLHLSDISTWCGRCRCCCRRKSEQLPPKSE